MRHGKLNVVFFVSTKTSNYTRKWQRKSLYFSGTSNLNSLTLLTRSQLGLCKTIQFVIFISSPSLLPWLLKPALQELSTAKGLYQEHAKSASRNHH